MISARKSKKIRKPIPYGFDPSRKHVPLWHKVVLYIGLILVISPVVIALINVRDRKLDVNAGARLRQGAAPVQDASNAVFAFYGSAIPAGQDPQSFGLNYVETANELLRAIDEDKPFDQNKLKTLDQQLKAVPWVGNAKNLCNDTNKDPGDCLHYFAAHPGEITQLAHDNTLRLARYRALYAYPAYADRMLSRESTVYPDMQGEEHETVLGEIAIEAADGNPDAAANDLAADTAFWRRVLAGAGTIYTKMAAARRLSENYTLASQIAALYKSRPGLLAPMTASLSTQEKNWSAAIFADYRIQTYSYISLANYPIRQSLTVWHKPFSALMEKLFFKLNDSINLAYRYALSLQTLTTVPGYKLIAKTRAMDAQVSKARDASALDFVYNPIGKALIRNSPLPDQFGRYVAQTVNLDGQVRLLNLQLAIYRDKVALKNIGAYVINASGTLYQPYAYEPMNWSTASDELSFQGVSEKSKGKIVRDMKIAVKL